MSEPRAYTADELRDQLLDHMRGVAAYWASVDREGISVQERIEGALFSTLVMLDGGSMGMCAWDLVAQPHDDDKEYLRSQGENWIEPGTVVSTALHEFWHKKEIPKVDTSPPTVTVQKRLERRAREARIRAEQLSQAEIDTAVAATRIPDGVYYSAESHNFYRMRDFCGMGVPFFEQWHSQADKFPSPWEIRDGNGNRRGEQFAKTAQEALEKYAKQCDISVTSIAHWNAVKV